MGENNNGDKGNHPAYQEILDVLPESLHSLVVPVLKKWDAGVTQKLQEVHASYEPLKAYKEFADSQVDPEYAKQAVLLADALERDPNKVVDHLNESLKLGYLNKEQAEALQAQTPEDADFNFDEGSNVDIMQNPQVKAMYDALQEIQKRDQEREQQSTEEAEIEAFEKELNELETSVTEKNLPFNRLFVTALMYQGVSGEEAVKQYHEILGTAAATQGDTGNQQQSQQPPPPVMGNEGATGAGLPDGTVDFGSLSKNDLNDYVTQMIAQSHESGQG